MVGLLIQIRSPLALPWRLLQSFSIQLAVVTNAVLKRGDLVLFDRNNHKAAHHGALLLGNGIPIYLETDRNAHGLIGPIFQILFFANLGEFAGVEEGLQREHGRVVEEGVSDHQGQPAGACQGVELVDFGLNQIPGVRTVIEKTSPMQRVFGADSVTALALESF